LAKILKPMLIFSKAFLKGDMKMRQGTVEIKKEKGQYWLDDLPSKTKAEVMRRASAKHNLKITQKTTVLKTLILIKGGAMTTIKIIRDKTDSFVVHLYNKYHIASIHIDMLEFLFGIEDLETLVYERGELEILYEAKIKDN
jgi:hypothetical protein